MDDSVQGGIWRVLVEGSNTSCQGGDWADGSPKRVVMDDRPFGAVFGVGNADGRAVR
jgi:hypothetical protein